MGHVRETFAYRLCNNTSKELTGFSFFQRFSLSKMFSFQGHVAGDGPCHRVIAIDLMFTKSLSVTQRVEV